MAYGNATAAIDSREKRAVSVDIPTTNAGGTAATHIYAGSVVGCLIATGTLIIAADTAALALRGIAADTQKTDAAAGDKLKVWLPGAIVWLKTLDTAAQTFVGKCAYVDYGASGTPQHVVGLDASGATNQIGMVGVIIDWVTGWYLVDTTLMGVPQAAASVNYESV